MTIPMNDFADKVFSKFGVSSIGLQLTLILANPEGTEQFSSL